METVGMPWAAGMPRTTGTPWAAGTALEYLIVKPNLIGFLGECCVIVFCFAGLRRKEKRLWLIPAGLSLLLNLVLYATSGSPGGKGSLTLFIARALFHAAAVCLYLFFSKRLALRSCILLSLLYIDGYQFSIGIRLLVSSLALGGSGLLSHLLATVTVLGIQFLWGAVIRSILRISDLEHISYSRWGVMGTLTLLQIYIRWSLMPELRSALDAPLWFKRVEYPLIAMASLLLIEIFYEISISLQARANLAQMEKLSLEYELKNIRQQTRSADDIRRIYHDMKNHLLAIEALDSSQKVREYAGELLSQFDSYETTVCTGNDVADALITEKMLLGRLDGISFHVCMDLRGLAFLRPVDLVSIFGNAMDNAMEAVTKLPAEKRRVYLRSVNPPGFVTLVFSNPSESVILDGSGAPVTCKEDRENHGIGLRSIRRSVERYGGVIQTQQDMAKRQFDLTILIPLR